jgi:rhodanese-related sulfurtransferase|tara:strand:+ start:368 stop:676 length:309 start_codon:yes stop_codon:yes gene_type:complete
MNLDEKKWTESIENSKNSKILDVRTPEEFDSGYIKESINLNIYDSHSFLEGIKGLSKSDFIHVYCRSGARSFQACEIMKQMGYQSVYNLEGGILDWQGEIIK